MITRFVLHIFMFIMIFPFLPGSDTAIFQGVSVFVGLLISIGSSSAIANAVAGLVITYMRPFKIGDRIKIDDITGDVMEKSALVTRIRTIKNEDITIPNAKILTSHTINYSAPARETGLIIHTTVTIGYDAPWRTVHSLLIEAAASTPDVLKTPPPFVLQTSLDDFYISYQVNVFVGDASRMMKIKSDLHQNIQDSFNRGGVEIMSPHYRSERDGNEVTIPKNWESGIEAFQQSMTIPSSPPDKKRGRKPKAK
jgi:small-conductance mechanosensitive channel